MEPRPEYIAMIKARGLGKFQVICLATMERFGILDQFHQLTDAIGIRELLYALLDCEAYLEPTITFLSTFRYEGGAIRFHITGPYHDMDLDEFCDRLGIPRGGRTESNKLVFKIWIRITQRTHTRDRKSNQISHFLFHYIHRSLSISVFARDETMSTVQLDEIFFIQCMLRKAGGLEASTVPNIGHYMAKKIKWVLSNMGSTRPFSCAGIVHLFAKGVGEDLSGYEVVPRIRTPLDETTLRRIQILGPPRHPSITST